jgi:hypothetical protein
VHSPRKGRATHSQTTLVRFDAAAQHDECIERCTEALGTAGIAAIDKAKAHFRRAAALAAKQDYEAALKACAGHGGTRCRLGPDS